MTAAATILPLKPGIDIDSGSDRLPFGVSLVGGVQNVFAAILSLICVSATLLLFLIQPALAGANTWTTAGPYGGGVYSLGVSPDFSSDHTLFAGTGNGRVFKSMSGGAVWTDASSGISLGIIGSILVSPAYAIDHTVFVVGNNGVYRSTNGGLDWTRLYVSLSPVWSGAFSPTYFTDHTLFLGSDDGVFKSTDGGATWTQANIGLTSLTVQCLVCSPDYIADQTLFAGTLWGGLFKSTDGGQSWAAMNSGLTGQAIVSIAISPSFGSDHTVFVATDADVSVAGASQGGRLFKSDSGGEAWTEVSPGFSFRATEIAISPVFSADHTLFFGTWNSGAFKSTTSGTSWTEINTGNPNHFVLTLALSPDFAEDRTLFAGTRGDGVFKSISSGENWSAASTGLLGGWIPSLVISPAFAVDQTIFAGIYDYGSIFRSTTGGATWNESDAGLPSDPDFPSSGYPLQCLAISPAFADDHTLFSGTWKGGISKSTSRGASWTVASSGLPEVPTYPYLSVNSIVLSPAYRTDQTVFAGVSPGGVFKSLDGGGTWLPVNSGLSNLDVSALAISPTFASDATLFAVTGHGVFRSTTGGSGWTAATLGLGTQRISAVSISPAFAADQTLFAAVWGEGVFRSTDGGDSWDAVDSGLSDLHVTAVAMSPGYVSDRTLYAATWGGVFRSTSGGTHWTAMNAGLSPPGEIYSLVVAPLSANRQRVFGGGAAGGIFAYDMDPISNVATLNALTLSAGTLSPAFASGTTSYTASVTNATSSITVTPTQTDVGSTIRVNGTVVTSGTPSGSITLSVGTNPITVAVTAQDGKTVQIYTVTVTRATAYASWASLYFPGNTNQMVIGASADPDHDGLYNAVEMVLGGNPANVMNADLLPTGRLVTNPDGTVPVGDYFLFTYRRTDASVAGGVVSGVEVDADMTGVWTQAVNGVNGVRIIETNDGYGSGVDHVQVYIPRVTNSRVFARLKVTVP